ncbi:MAG: tetratricopeptide repeat protein [Gammaproteobacteria bacterium]
MCTCCAVARRRGFRCAVVFDRRGTVRCRNPCPAMSLALSLLLALLPSVLEADWLAPSERRARAYFAQGRYEAAAAAFQDAYRRGVACYRAGRYREAEQAFASVVRGEVQLDAQYNLGNARFRMGEYGLAIEAYEAVLKRHPGHADARHNLALARRWLEQKDSAGDVRKAYPAPLSEGQPGAAESQQPTRREKPADAGLPRQDEDKGVTQESSETSLNDKASEQDPHQGQTGETSEGASDEGEDESTGEAEGGQQSGAAGQQISAVEGGSEGDGRSAAGSSTAGGESMAGTGAATFVTSDDSAGVATTSEQSASTGEIPDRDRHDDSGQASDWGGESQHDRGPVAWPARAPSEGVNRGAGQDSAALADVPDPPEGEPESDSAGHRSMAHPREIGDPARDPQAGTDKGVDAAIAGTDAQRLPRSARGSPTEPSTVNDQRAVGGDRKFEDAHPLQTPDAERGRALEQSEFPHLRQIGAAAPESGGGDEGGLDWEGAVASMGLSGANSLVEGWLERIGGDPVPLLRSRFALEEQAFLRRGGGDGREHRPW